MDIHTPIDIKTLIQTSSIEIFSEKNKTKLIQKLQNHFTEEEQGLYICNLFLYLKHHPVNDYIINLDNIWKFIGFSNKGNAKRLLQQHFTENEDYKITLLRNQKRKNEGGFNQETILLNINTFKKMCLKANTDKADKIHDYYIKLEMLFNQLVKDEMEENKRLLKEKNKEIEKTKEESVMHKHNVILKEYSVTNSGIVYIIKVKTLEKNKYIVKIGESRIGLLSRYKEHKTKYPECLILDCFNVKNSKNFEKFLHNTLRNWKYNKLTGHEYENELFLIGEELTYNYIEKLINDNLQKFNDDTCEIEKLRLETEKLRLELDKLKLENQHLKNYESVPNILREITHLKELMKNEFEKINVIKNTKTTNNFNEPYHAIGKKVQQINPENSNLIKVYNCVAEVCKIFGVSRSSLVKAINCNTIYKNFRWCYVDDNENIVNIEPTLQLKKVFNNGYIAKLNKDKTEILNLYLDRKTASILNNYDSIAYLDNYVKSGKLVGEHYYVLYDNCDQILKNKFINKIKKEPVLYKKGIGKFDKDNNLIQEYKSQYNCINSCSIGSKSLSKALSKQILYNGYYYKFLDEKLFL
jgi:phage anti-repressor protein